MFKKLIRNRKAQQTAEYALLISLVVAAVIAMQTYAQRTIQARIRDASQYLTAQTSGLGVTNQYEPYYLQSDYDIDRSDVKTERLDDSQVGGFFGIEQDQNRSRLTGGQQTSTYNAAGLNTGL